MDEPKCNIQKENKMMGAAGQPPIITHTAATPQDSPNTTLDVGYRDLNCRAVYPTAALSIESIDRSGVRIFLHLFFQNNSNDSTRSVARQRDDRATGEGVTAITTSKRSLRYRGATCFGLD